MPVESSGAAVMRPKTGEFWACWGRPAENEYVAIAPSGGGETTAAQEFVETRS